MLGEANFCKVEFSPYPLVLGESQWLFKRGKYIRIIGNYQETETTQLKAV